MRLDLVIVGSGPAGLAAASHAAASGLSYVVLERAPQLADTIHNYQARKYVMAEPMLIPARSDVPFAAGSRESILDGWQRHAGLRQLRIEFNAEVRSIEKTAEGFTVTAATGNRWEARHVIIAMGTQGSPRRLGAPGETMPHVLYRLNDPAEHAGQDILVVGAGDSALEIALALAGENRVGLVVRGSEIARANEVLTREVLARQAAGGLTVYFNATVREVFEGHADLNVRGETVRVPARWIFLKLGADPPRKFLEGIGVRFSGRDATRAHS